jgi:hypothetical protein
MSRAIAHRRKTDVITDKSLGLLTGTPSAQAGELIRRMTGYGT